MQDQPPSDEAAGERDRAKISESGPSAVAPDAAARHGGSTLFDTRTASGSHSHERAAPIAAATWIGRYRIIGLIGSGGLGNVYRAHDPALMRDVALKILHHRFESAAPDAARQRRLLLEGQALAKLSHPSVVTVYDVGAQGGVVFFAMELVHGHSLSAWLGAGASRNDVIGVLIAAGRGLAAAHAAGVAHGDFKPANVMVSRENEVRIVDFGLARSLEDGGAAEQEPSGARGVAHAMAAPGADAPHSSWRGTLGYVAPELLRAGGTADVQADQYSFAVTAFVALSGQQPYAAQTPDEYRGALASGARALWPSSVPRRVRRVVERGMALSAADRYPDVGALIDALEQATRPRSRGVIWAAASLVAVLLVGGAAVVRGRANDVRCELDPRPFAGVWDAERRALVERSMLSTGRPNASEAFALLAPRLDTFQAGWLEMQREACQSSLVSAAQSERVFALRSTCLQHKLEGFAALVDAFAHADAGAVDRAGGIMPDTIQQCADVPALTGVADALPADPAQRAAIEEVSSSMAVIGAEITAGRDTTARARQLHEKALAIGHTPTIATTLSVLGRTMVASGRGDAQLIEAKAALQGAVRLAAQVGDRELLALTASYLLNVIAFQEKRTDEADAMLPMVDAFVNQAGNDPELRLEVLISQASILQQRGQYLEAIAVFEQAATLSREVQSHRRTYGALALGKIGEIYIELRRYPEAVRSRRAEVEGVRGIYGSGHPRLLLSQFNLGIALVESGMLDAARETAASLRQLVVQLLLPNDWRLATLPFLEANIFERDGDCAAAVPLYRDALQKLTGVLGTEHANTADIYQRLGNCLHATQQTNEGVAQLEHALAIRRKLGAAPKVAEVAFELAQVLWAKGQSSRGRALALAKEAVSLWRGEDVRESRIVAERWLEARVGHGVHASR